VVGKPVFGCSIPVFSDSWPVGLANIYYPQPSPESCVQADDSGLDVKQVGTFVCGRGNPTYETLLKLCEGLHVSLGESMVRADELYERRLGR
jgi:hypothetical protein